MQQDLLKGLTKEQIEKARACKSSEELLKLARQEGIELTDEQLEAISGGACLEPRRPIDLICPQCGSSNVSYEDFDMSDTRTTCHCKDCGFSWSSSIR